LHVISRDEIRGSFRFPLGQSNSQTTVTSEYYQILIKFKILSRE